ncbi:MAG: YhgE/Pip family protein [Burkholderiales bacterium]
MFLSDAFAVSRLDARLFKRFPRLLLSLAGIVLIPALYGYIYLESVWDPITYTRDMPAAIVNLDRGTRSGGTAVDLGAEATRMLKGRGQFAFYEVDDPETARRHVREGRSLFALIVPPEFSEAAVGAAAEGSGRITVYASEGNNYAGAGFAKRFAEEIGHQLNDALAERRWAAVLGASASTADRLAKLRAGIGQLQTGAGALEAGLKQAEGGSTRLAAGAGEYAAGVARAVDGTKQLAAGVRAIDARRPPAEDAARLKTAAARLADGHDRLQAAFPPLEDGARRLGEGATELREETEDIPFIGTRLATAAEQLADGAGLLRGGIRTTSQGAAQLAGGARELSKGVAQAADGFTAFSGGVGALAARIPPDTQFDPLLTGGTQLTGAAEDLRGGLAKLRDASTRLGLGLRTLETALPTSLGSVSGTPGGLAVPVRPQLEIDAPVKTNGMGLAPNFIPVSLWLGAVMAAFVDDATCASAAFACLEAFDAFRRKSAHAESTDLKLGVHGGPCCTSCSARGGPPRTSAA